MLPAGLGRRLRAIQVRLLMMPRVHMELPRFIVACRIPRKGPPGQRLSVCQHLEPPLRHNGNAPLGACAREHTCHACEAAPLHDLCRKAGRRTMCRESAEPGGGCRCRALICGPGQAGGRRIAAKVAQRSAKACCVQNSHAARLRSVRSSECALRLVRQSCARDDKRAHLKHSSQPWRNHPNRHHEAEHVLIVGRVTHKISHGPFATGCPQQSSPPWPRVVICFDTGRAPQLALPM
eukprot:scaffold33523_cov112-Isochrysis_galbana.AAC.7